MIMRKYCAVSVFLLAAILGANALRGLEVADVRWGFNGRAVPGHLNILTLQVFNPEDRAFEGMLELEALNGLGEPVGAVMIAPAYLAPRTARRVQFVAYVSNGPNGFRIKWGGGIYRLEAPSLGPPARVRLLDTDNPFGGGGGGRGFPDNMFPATVLATDGLESVVLDHVPAWEKPQRRAFMDWVRRGGTVHLFHSSQGTFPEFRQMLAPLNDAAETSRIGAGRVQRHARRARGLNAAYWQAAGCPELGFAETDNYYGGDFSEQVIQSLGGAVNPNHSWGLIYTLIVLYMIIIGPVNFLVSRKAKRFQVSIIILVSSIALFSLLFMMLGRRGYGEKSVIHSLTYARVVDDEQFDVTQWVNLFVTDGDYYRIAYPGNHNYYATCQTMESVNAKIINGVQAQFMVDIPLYSRRGFLHRGTVPRQRMKGCRISGFKGGEGLRELSLDCPGLKSEAVHEAWAWYNGSFYRLDQTGDALVRAATSFGTPAEEFFPSDMLENYNMYRYMEEEVDFSDMSRSLIARALGGYPRFSPAWQSIPRRDEVHVFIYAATAPEFQMNHPDLGSEQGFTLYHIILPVDGKGIS